MAAGGIARSLAVAPIRRTCRPSRGGRVCSHFMSLHSANIAPITGSVKNIAAPAVALSDERGAEIIKHSGSSFLALHQSKARRGPTTKSTQTAITFDCSGNTAVCASTRQCLFSPCPCPALPAWCRPTPWHRTSWDSAAARRSQHRCPPARRHSARPPALSDCR